MTGMKQSPMVRGSLGPSSPSEDVGVGEMELDVDVDVDVDVELWNVVVMVEVWKVEEKEWSRVELGDDREEVIVVSVAVVSANGGARRWATVIWVVGTKGEAIEVGSVFSAI